MCLYVCTYILHLVRADSQHVAEVIGHIGWTGENRPITVTAIQTTPAVLISVPWHLQRGGGGGGGAESYMTSGRPALLKYCRDKISARRPTTSAAPASEIRRTHIKYCRNIVSTSSFSFRSEAHVQFYGCLNMSENFERTVSLIILLMVKKQYTSYC